MCAHVYVSMCALLLFYLHGFLRLYSDNTVALEGERSHSSHFFFLDEDFTNQYLPNRKNLLGQ